MQQNPNPNRRPPSGPRDSRQAQEAGRAAYERQRAHEAELARRKQASLQHRKLRRKRAVRLFFGRLIVFFIIFATLAAVAAAVFFFLFNKTDAPETPRTFIYTYPDGSAATLAGELAVQDGIVYMDFSAFAAKSGMAVIGGAEEMRFVLRDGTEEYVVFYAGRDLATVNGQDIRLGAKALRQGEAYLVPLSFLTEQMNGVAVLQSEDTVTLTIGEEGLSLKLAPAETIPPVTEDPDLPTVNPSVTFLSDLSAFEEYMNPTDRDAYLMLANKTTRLDSTFIPPNLTNIVDTRKDGRATQKMQLAAARALEALFIELRANGFTDLSVTSGYRAYSYQQTLFTQYTSNEMAQDPSLTRSQAEAIVETYSARPGTSEHQLGLCVDMHNLPSALRAFADQPAYKWLKENAWKFGFIIRYPEDKTDITGYSFEPWHYRFVGRYHAKIMHDEGLCLEEYLTKYGY